jgi:hypothetical protein
MPVSTPSSHVTAKSTLRHRPIAPDVKAEEPPRVPRASRTQTPKPTSNTTWRGEVPAWKAAAHQPSHQSQRVPMVGIGIGMFIAVILVLLGQFLLGWFATTLDDLHYGRPRTFQIDAVVGQGDSPAHPSHFIALNLKGQVEVIELPAGNAAQAKIYLGPRLYGPQADLVPITLQFVDPRHDHQPDMIVLFQGLQVVFRNTQGSFHAPLASS